MLSIYNYMASGVLLTGIVALLTARTGLVYSFAGGPLMWLVALSPLAIVFAMSFGAQKLLDHDAPGDVLGFRRA
jgi:FtsH-binding integral membrane protein